MVASILTYAQKKHNHSAADKSVVHAVLHEHKTKAEKRGHELYMEHCAGCHGEEGGGAGPLAYNNETGQYRGIYSKHKPWPLGCPGTASISDSQIKDIVTKGRYCPEHGPVMPQFQLPEKEIRLIIKEVRALSHWHGP